jgi:hypothetical protein
VRKLLAALTVSLATWTCALPANAELGSDMPSDTDLLARRVQEAGTAGSGIFDIAAHRLAPYFDRWSAFPVTRSGVVWHVSAAGRGPPCADLP